MKLSSYWRRALEDTNQDPYPDYREYLLRALRDTLEMWVASEAAAVIPTLRRYLKDQRTALKRLALHILNRYPAMYPLLVSQELSRRENLYDTRIHHEFLVLLRTGYRVLDQDNRTRLLNSLLLGPSSDQLEGLRQSMIGGDWDDPEAEVRLFSETWIRDRLWVLRNDLPDEGLKVLEDLQARLGQPGFDPTFTSWIGESGFVVDLSPESVEELAAMSPDELSVYMEEWEPPAEEHFTLSRVSHRGLAQAIARVILREPAKYEAYLPSLLFVQPEYADAVLNQLWDAIAADENIWHFAITVCEAVNWHMQEWISGNKGGEDTRIEVRRSMVRVLERGSSPETRLPASLHERARSILFCLIDDPDPDEETDHPPEGFFGHNDPASIAINAVRPRALHCLVRLVGLSAGIDDAATQHLRAPGPRRWDLQARDALSRKLDRGQDPSWSVHSVYGRDLSWLNWLDSAWLSENLDRIFPEDDGSTNYFIAAWDSYVSYHNWWSSGLDSLRPKYVRAIEYLRQGLGTSMEAPRSPRKMLVIHLTTDYVRSDYDIHSPSGSYNLLGLLYREVLDVSADVAWTFSQLLHNSAAYVAGRWSRVRDVWEWRTSVAATADKPEEYADEMRNFALMLPVLPSTETLASVHPLLEQILPHITQQDRRSFAWDAVEKYLALEVADHPVDVISMYHRMHELSVPRRSYRLTEEARSIIETAAREKEAEEIVLKVLDVIARKHGNDELGYVYDRLRRL